MGEWKHNATILGLDTRVNGHLQAPAALPPGKEPSVLIEGGCVLELVWTL
jgi:hypothetical protein